MKTVYLILAILIFDPVGVLAQLSLTIEILDLRNNSGQVHLELSNSNEKQVATVTKSIIDGKCLIIVDKLNPGSYAFKFIHDENKNDKLDANWMGIPKEGFGFSNNPSMTFGPPSFDKTIFELKESVVITCKPKYF